ncbi:rhomboid family intramembrane serine protease [Mucilaginibacter sp. P25]|uniref:Rhomboid protease GluP n=1 Tax=Mucilaginibacter gossypii TaxID=551996 RepID=A0A1G8LNJ0_9SPHI|nr:rhomboid family intramembrane serine protease [Mucilaginibacter gossypii]SDI57279.1 rhomboid protease GluP [Mucilaginibacter gossypii]
MAFSFTPSFKKQIDTNNADPKHILVIALETARQLDWRIIYTGKNGLITIIGGGLFSPMQEFRLVINQSDILLISKNADGKITDWSEMNEENVNTFIEKYDQLKTSLNSEFIEEKLVELTPIFESEEEDILNAPPPTPKEKLLGFLSFFIPRPEYFITPIIINVNIAIFIIMVIRGVSTFEPTVSDLISWGANFGPLTLDNQYWRLITAIFLHIGIMHLLLNMYALMYIGMLLEPWLGKLKFAAAYLLTGLSASIVSVTTHGFIVSAGASGAIFGMYGVFLSMLTTNIIEKNVRKQLLVSIGFFVAFNLLYGTKEGIDNAAHVGGLVSGFIIGYLYYPSLSKPDNTGLEVLSVMSIAVLTLLCCTVTYYQTPNPFAMYQKKMKDFAVKESMALEVMQMPKNTAKDVLMSELKDRGIYYWNENIQVINSADSLDLPEPYKVRDNMLKKYCQLRINSYNLLYKRLQDSTTVRLPSIDSVNREIAEIIDDLSKHNK